MKISIKDKAKQKSRFERWVVVLFLIFAISFFTLLFVGAAWEGGKIESDWPITMIAVSSIIFILFGFALFLFLINIRLPKVRKWKNQKELFLFLLIAFFVLFFIYGFGGKLIFYFLFGSILPAKTAYQHSTALLAILLMLIYRASIYFDDILTIKGKNRFNGFLFEIKNRLFPFDLFPTFFNSHYYVTKYRNLILDFVGLSFLISLLTFFYSGKILNQLIPSSIHYFGALAALIIEMVFWYGLVQNKYWKK